MKTKKWIVQFRRPLIMCFGMGPTSWMPGKESIGPGRVRYWNGGSLTLKYAKAYGYTTEEAAEKAAFRLATKCPSLIAELEVVPFRTMIVPRR